MTKFWVVWCPRGGMPMVRHATRNAADKEAERLAKDPINIHKTQFFVLEAMSVTKVLTSVTTEELSWL